MNSQTGLSENKHTHRRVRVEFYNHLIAFIVVNALLVGINLATSSDYLWFIWPLMGWGAGLLINGLQVFFVNKDQVDDEDLR
jgi:hypothetical protein